MPPTADATTGRPVDIASITVRPKGSSQTEGTTTTSAAWKGVTTSLRMASWWTVRPAAAPKVSPA